MLSEQTFKTIFNNAADGIVLADIKSQKLFMANETFFRMTGYNADELKSLSVADIHPDNDLSFVLDQFKKQSRGEITLARDIPVKRKNGIIFYADINALQIHLDNKYYLMGIFRDVTERKKLEEELLFKTSLLEAQSETSIDGILVVDDEGKTVFFNKRFAKMWGIPQELLDQKDDDKMLQFVIARLKEPDKFIEKVRFLYSHKKETSTDEIEFKDGRFFDRYSSPMIGRYGEYFGRIWYFRDITAHKKVDNSLKDSEEKFRSLTASIPGMVFRARGDWSVEFISNSHSICGYSPDEFYQRKISWIDLIHCEDKDLIIKEGDRLCHEKISIISEYRIINKNGEIRWVEDHKTSNFNSDGVFIRVDGIVFDITERKLAEENAKLFKTIADMAGYGVVINDLKGNAIYTNESMAQMFDYTLDEIHNHNLSFFHSKKQMENVNALNTKVMEEGRYIAEEISFIDKKGKKHYVLMNGTLVRNEKDHPQYLASTAIDITERRKTEDALRESEEKYRALVESAGETIAMIDKNGMFLFMNTTAAQRLGGKADDYIGKSMWDVFPKDIADQQVADLQDVINNNHGKRVISLTEAQGNLKWYETTIEPLRNNQEQVQAAMIIARDITEMKKTREELDKYREEMAHAERLASLGTLSATAAHELTQPLTVIRLLIENAMTKLKKTSSPETIVEQLRESLTEISNITSVVDRFRNFARKSSEKVVKEVDLRTIINRIVNLLSESSHHSGVKITIENMDELPYIYSNEKELEQLFFALIDNAIYAAGDEENRQIIISGNAQKEIVELRFTDNCGGIAPENIERVFEPFFTTKPAGQGTGLGLCIVRDIVLRAGGKIRLESELGEGSTFIVTLPVNKELK